MNNYNLMRLANLYGGMNKSAANDGATVVAKALKRKVDAGEMTPAEAAEVLKSHDRASGGWLSNNALTNPNNPASLPSAPSSDPLLEDPTSTDSLTAIETMGGKPFSLVQHGGSFTLDPAVGREVKRTEPALGYTLGTEDQAMRLYKDELAKDPSLWEKIKEWIAANPGKSTAIGAGALGLGGLGAYAMMRDKDEEEEGRKKTASYIDPYVAQVLAHDYITKMASANGIPTVAAGVTGVSNYLNLR